MDNKKVEDLVKGAFQSILNKFLNETQSLNDAFTAEVNRVANAFMETYKKIKVDEDNAPKQPPKEGAD